MKIIKLPIETKITCECGCEFEFDTDDIEQIGYVLLDGTTYNHLIVDCPFCKQRHTIQEKMITLISSEN